jgi:glutamine synthetase
VQITDVRTAQDVRALLAERHVEHVTVAVVDLQGQVRGKYLGRDKFLGALDDGMAMAPVIQAFDFGDTIQDVAGLSDDVQGFGDASVRIVADSCREIPWEAAHRNLFFLAEFAGEAAEFDPRRVYGRTVERARAMGLRPFHALEYEFTLFKESPKSVEAKGFRDLELLTTQTAYLSVLRQTVSAALYADLMDTMQALRVPLECVHVEMGPGFTEAALSYGEGLEAADQAVVFKTFAKAVAQRRGLLATFMARWSNEADGQSGHVHVSLRDDDGAPVFHDASARDGMSRTMRHFVGGLQALLPELLAMLAPNVNSWKRFVPGIFAPVAATWGVENRTCAVRVVPGSPRAQRVECRVPGADGNPYLVLAALVGAGLWGIEHGAEPSEPVRGNLYAQLDSIPDEQRFPETFADGIRRFRASEAANKLFGERFVQVFADTREFQEREFRALVTDRELQRFFELA